MCTWYIPEAVNSAPCSVGPASRQEFVVVYFYNNFQFLETRVIKLFLRLVSFSWIDVFTITEIISTARSYNRRRPKYQIAGLTSKKANQQAHKELFPANRMDGYHYTP
jgi:hypothetical protein